MVIVCAICQETGEIDDGKGSAYQAGLDGDSKYLGDEEIRRLKSSARLREVVYHRQGNNCIAQCRSPKPYTTDRVCVACHLGKLTDDVRPNPHPCGRNTLCQRKLSRVT